MRGLKAGGGFVENRRGIEHRGIEPLPVELVAKIVMRLDIAAAATSGVGIQPVCKPVDETHGQAAAHRPCKCLAILSGETDERCQVRRRPVIFDETFRKADIAVDEQPADGPPVMQHENGFATFRIARFFDVSTARKGYAQSAALDIVQQPADEPCAHAGTTVEASALRR
ncbi:hypothetical protein D3C86_1370800 [compost metagenome]